MGSVGPAEWVSRLFLSPCPQNPWEAWSLCWLEGKKQEEGVGGGGM